MSTDARALVDRLTEYPGSTRGVALMRIGIALVAWAELGEAMQAKDVGWPMSLFFYASTATLLLGVHARVAAAAAAVCFWYTIDAYPGAMHHHTYLMAMETTVLALTPCGRSLSFDRWLAVRRAAEKNEPVPAEEGNLWAVRLMGLQFCAVLFWGGYNKLTFGTHGFHSSFMTGDRIEQTMAYYHSFPAELPWWLRVFFPLLGTSVVLFELAAGFLLWVPKARPFVLVGCLFMTSTFQVLLNVGTFGLLAAVLYLAFVPPERVHGTIDRLLGALPEPRKAVE